MLSRMGSSCALLLLSPDPSALHEARRGRWERHYGFRLRRGLTFRQHCDHDDCTEPEHLYLVEGVPEQTDRRWRRAVSSGPRGWNRGTANPRAKLTPIAVHSIRIEYAAGASVAQLALAHGLHERTVYRILSGEVWK